MTDTAVYDARPISVRGRATKAEMVVRRLALFKLAQEHQPCSVRHVYYQAVVAGVPGIAKTDAGYRKVQRELLAMRRDNEMPWHWIVDNSRSWYAANQWSRPEDFISEMAGVYRRDLWSTSHHRVEVWCESESIASTIMPVADYWRVPVFPTRGQSSDSYIYGAVQQWKRTPDRTPVVLYIGDHDPAGLEIEASLMDKVGQHSKDTFPGIVFDRIGVTWDQVVEHDLPGGRPKKDYGYPLAVEAEALRPQLLRDLLYDAIAKFIDEGRLERLRRVEEIEQTTIARFGEWLSVEWVGPEE